MPLRRRAWVPAAAIGMWLLVGGAMAWMHGGAYDHAVTLVSEHRSFEAMRASCPGGLDDLRLGPVGAQDPTGPEEGWTVVEGRAYGSGPADGPEVAWSVTPLAEDLWPGRVEWTVDVYQLPGLAPVLLQGERASHAFDADGNLLRQVFAVALPAEPAAPGPGVYLLVLERNGACGSAFFAA